MRRTKTYPRIIENNPESRCRGTRPNAIHRVNKPGTGKKYRVR